MSWSFPRAFVTRWPMLLLALPFLSALLFLLMVWGGHAGLNSVVGEMRSIVGTNLDGSVRISEIARRLQQINTTLFEIMTIQAANDKTPVTKKTLDGLVNDITALRGSLSDYRNHFASPKEAAAIDEALAVTHDYQIAIQWVGSLLEIDFASAVAYLKPFHAIFERLSQQFDRIIADAVTDARNHVDDAAAFARLTVVWTTIGTLLTTLFIAICAWLTGRHQQRLLITASLLEERVTERTQELAQRSIELEDSLNRLRETQTKLIMQEKMASLGQLVAGVAHEINSPISVVLLSASMLADDLDKVQTQVSRGHLRKSEFETFLARAQEAVTLILANIGRAVDLIQSFKMVAVDRTSDQRRSINLKTYLDEILLSLAPIYRKAGHRVTLSCPDDIVMVSYPGALSQIITNLLTNSVVHAFDEGTAGHLSIDVSPTGGPTDPIRMTYADTGKGIPPENHRRVFDPFYTTRRSNGGSGLGLHIVYNLATNRLGGDIRLDSADGTGTRFTLLLPRTAPTSGGDDDVE